MIRRLGRSLLGVDGGLDPVVHWWHVALPFVAATVLLLFRLPAESWNVLWAEDGAIFLTDAYSGNPLVLLQAYAGYLHVVPRIVAGLTVATTPVLFIPLVFTIVSAAIAGAVATVVFLFARHRIRSILVSGLLAAMVILLPVAGGEVALNIANLHWYLIVGAFWAAIVTPRRRWFIVLQCAVVASAVLSDPLAALLLAPLVLARLLAVRPLRGRDQAVSWTYLGVSVVQGVATVIATLVDRSRSPSPLHPSALDFADAYSGRVVLDSLLGVSGASAVYQAIGGWAIVVAVALVGGSIVAVAWRDRARRALVVVFAAASVGFSFVVFFLEWDALVGVPPGTILPGGRYLVVPILLLASAYAVCADFAAGRLAPRRLGWLPIAVLAAIVVVPGVVDYRVMDIRQGATPWQQSLDAGARFCAAAGDVTHGEAQIAPAWFPPALIPCEVLERAASPDTIGAGPAATVFQEKAAQ